MIMIYVVNSPFFGNFKPHVKLQMHDVLHIWEVKLAFVLATCKEARGLFEPRGILRDNSTWISTVRTKHFFLLEDIIEGLDARDNLQTDTRILMHSELHF